MADAGDQSRARLKAEARDWRRVRLASGDPVTHGAALEHVARRHGFRDWNTACAAFPAALAGAPTGPGPLRSGDRVAGTYLGRPFAGALTASTGLPGGRTRVTVLFDEPINVTPSLSFAHRRRRVSATVGEDGLTAERTSDGEPHLRLRRA